MDKCLTTKKVISAFTSLKKRNKIILGIVLGVIVLFAIIPSKDNPTIKGPEVARHVSTDKVTDQTSTSTVRKVTTNTDLTTLKIKDTSSNTTDTYYSVTQVVDGDTVKININESIVTLRLIGMDTPETVDPRKEVQCFGIEASNKAKELLSNQKVRIEKDSSQGELDKYGRTLAYVYLENGVFFNKYMIEQGYAHEYTYDVPYKYQNDFKLAQKSAQDNLRGLWSPDTCNGDTTSAPTADPQPAVVDSGNPYYTSSYYSAKYYYPEACDGWKSLSPKYLKSFNSLDELLATYSRTKSPQCN